MGKVSNDKQNLECDTHLRYSILSGQSSLNGDKLWACETQEGSSIALCSGTGEGSDGTGPGTARIVQTTQGASIENLGAGLKVRDPSDTTQLPAKFIKCVSGDVIIDCDDGDITLKARNINIVAKGADQSGQVDVFANRLVNVTTQDMRVSAQKTVVVSKDLNVISKGGINFLYGCMKASSFADQKFGALTANLTKSNIKTIKSL